MMHAIACPGEDAKLHVGSSVRGESAAGGGPRAMRRKVSETSLRKLVVFQADELLSVGKLVVFQAEKPCFESENMLPCWKGRVFTSLMSFPAKGDKQLHKNVCVINGHCVSMWGCCLTLVGTLIWWFWLLYSIQSGGVIIGCSRIVYSGPRPWHSRCF